jgi:hypothetical protein
MTPAPNEPLYALLDNLCDGVLSSADAARLDDILRGDPAARRRYLAYLELHASLGLTAGEEMKGERGTMNDERRCPLPGAAVPPIHHSSFIIHHYAGAGALLCYTIAGLLLGLVVLTTCLWSPSQRAVASHDGTPVLRDGIPSPPSVTGSPIGKITKVENCRWWGHPDYSTKMDDVVAVGQKYALDSGTLEITYAMGAKVVLQGHCAYEVDSPNSGLLWVGALKVNVPTASAVAARGAETDVLASPAVAAPRPEVVISGPHVADSSVAPVLPAKFVLRTRDFVITDHRGAFGIAVIQMGKQCTTRVFNLGAKILVKMNRDSARHGSIVRFEVQRHQGDPTYSWEIIEDGKQHDNDPGGDTLPGLDQVPREKETLHPPAS